MSIKLSDYLVAVATQTGAPIDSDEFKALLSNQSLAEIELPASVHERFTKGLLTVEAAKNNAELASYFKVKALGGVDNLVTKQLKELDLDEATLNEVIAEKDSYKRVQKLLELTPKQFEAKLKTQFGDNVKGKEEYIAKIDLLNKQINEERNSKVLLEQEYAGKLTERDKFFEQFQIQHHFEQHLSKYNLTKALPIEDLKVVIAKKLEAEPVVFKLVDGKPLPFQKENPDLEAHGAKGRMTYQEVLDKVVQPYLDKPAEPKRSTSTFVQEGNKSTYARPREVQVLGR